MKGVREMQNLQDMHEYTAILTPSSAAAMLGVSTQTLREYEKEGKLTAALRTSGGQRRYSLSAVNALLRVNMERNEAKDAARIPYDPSFGDIEPTQVKNMADVGRQFAAIQARLEDENRARLFTEVDDEDVAGTAETSVTVMGFPPHGGSFPTAASEEDN